MRYDTFPSPLGTVLVAGDAAGLHLLRFQRKGAPAPPDRSWSRSETEPLLREARIQLDAYFAGSRRSFDLPLCHEATGLRADVFHALLQIRFGETRSYGQIARELGIPRGARTVGGAVGSNPLPIVIPCHRVIGADGDLTGYGGGLEAKRFLLRLENVPAAAEQLSFGGWE